MNKSPIYDPVKRRCVIFEVLKDFVSLENCMKALWILENDYAKQHSLPILEFIDHVEKISALGENKKPLRERLTKELYFSSEIGKDPWEDMMRYKRVAQLSNPPNDPNPTVHKISTPEKPQKAVNTSTDFTAPVADIDDENADVPTLTEMVPPEIIVFNNFMKEINHYYTVSSKGYIQKFYSFLINHLPDLRITPEVEAAIIAWCHKDGHVAFANVFTTVEMSKVLHTCYVWGCDALGPDPTDKIFSRAIHETEKLAEADDFPPSSLM